MAGIPKTDPDDPQYPFPPDLRMQRDTVVERDAIPMYIRWEGMQCYVVQEATTYYLKGGVDNSNWQVLASGGGEGGSTFLADSLSDF